MSFYGDIPYPGPGGRRPIKNRLVTWQKVIAAFLVMLFVAGTIVYFAEIKPAQDERERQAHVREMTKQFFIAIEYRFKYALVGLFHPEGVALSKKGGQAEQFTDQDKILAWLWQITPQAFEEEEMRVSPGQIEVRGKLSTASETFFKTTISYRPSGSEWKLAAFSIW